jgi:hypothetical protein
MAVRMAFVEMQETTARLPLFMDETLANTDDLKARAIIESAVELARQGRQVFYLTAQGDEVARWQEALNNRNEVDCVVKDLAKRQDSIDAQITVPDLEAFRTELPTPPSPEGRTHARYGEVLDVPPLDPRRGAGAAHIWYVVDDVELLHRLLGMGLRHWGTLANILDNGNERTISDREDLIQRIRQNGAALETFVRVWRIGRGKPVDRAALDKSGAVSDTFIDDVTELAREVDGDASQLIECLQDGQVARFRTEKIEELARYCEENGYIDPSPTRDRTEIRMRMTSTLVDMGCSREEAGQRAARLLNRFATGPEST